MPFPARTFLRTVAGLFAPPILGSLLFGCGQTGNEPHRYTRFAMGTVVEYAVVGVDENVAREAVEKAQTEIERVAGLLWEGDASSDIYRVNASCRSDGLGTSCVPVPVSEETRHFLSRTLSYSTESTGAFDVTVGSFLEFYDFEGENPTPPDTHDIQVVREVLGKHTLAVDSVGLSGFKSGIRLTVGGVAKGYAVDRAVSVLRQSGIRSALVNAGGDLYCLGTNNGEPWRIGIRDPDDPVEVIAVLEMSDAAVATSGDYQQYFEVDGIRYHHLLDPATGLPARRARSATVIAETTERADALATALFVAGQDGLRFIEEANRTEGLLVDVSGRRYTTSGYARFGADPVSSQSTNSSDE